MGIEMELEESEFAGYAPDGTKLTAKVVGIKLDEKPFTDDDGNKVKKVVFKFLVVDPDSPFDGAFFYGETGTRFNTHPRCKMYVWASNILDRQLPAKYKLDTDDLLDQFCVIDLQLEEYTKNGENNQRNKVRKVFAADGTDHIGTGVVVAGSEEADAEPF